MKTMLDERYGQCELQSHCSTSEQAQMQGIIAMLLSFVFASFLPFLDSLGGVGIITVHLNS